VGSRRATAVKRLVSLAVLAAASQVFGHGSAQAGSGTARVIRSAVFVNPCEVARLRLRCPDLVMSAPSQLHLDRSTRPGRTLLRATSSINNHGRGPIELRANRHAGKWRVYQAIYDVSGRAHLARTIAALTFKFVPSQRYAYGPVGAATYWKLRNAAGFQLWSVDAGFRAISLVRTGPKVDYCLRDLRRTALGALSPASAVYPGCNRDRGIRRDVLGTSVGWSDVYPYEYPEQWIDVTGLRGRFAFVQVADPEGLLIESDHRNNLSETFVQLPSGRVLGRRVAVAGP
jgi:hypothetical protein